MSPADLAKRIAALDWSGVPLLHQLAVVAVLETLKETPMQTQSNIITLPVKRKNRWTCIVQLDGRPWATSFDFGPDGAWAWIVESVAHECDVDEDQIGSVEGTEDQFDGDDLVTIDGLPAYRIRTEWK